MSSFGVTTEESWKDGGGAEMETNRSMTCSDGSSSSLTGMTAQFTPDTSNLLRILQTDPLAVYTAPGPGSSLQSSYPLSFESSLLNLMPHAQPGNLPPPLPSLCQSTSTPLNGRHTTSRTDYSNGRATNSGMICPITGTSMTRTQFGAPLAITRQSGVPQPYVSGLVP